MKGKFGAILLVAVALAVSLLIKDYAKKPSDMLTNVMMCNVEALAADENKCDYDNGYKAFTKKGGGAYDCCKEWESHKPDTDEGNCR